MATNDDIMALLRKMNELLVGVEARLARMEADLDFVFARLSMGRGV